MPANPRQDEAVTSRIIAQGSELQHTATEIRVSVEYSIIHIGKSNYEPTTAL